MENWKQPQRWNARHAEFFAHHGRRQRVFCASLADVFDNAVDPAWRADLFELIAGTPNLDWLLLTKRIGNAGEMIVDALLQRKGLKSHAPWPWPNVWLGATIVNQEEADRDIPKLFAVPASVRFLSMEPLLGPVDLAQAGALWSDMNNNIIYAPARNLRGIDWLIAGGESGPDARPMHPEWARSLRDQCAAAGVPFLFKQWGEWLPVETDEDSYATADDGSKRELDGRFRMTELGEQRFFRTGKKTAGRLLDGRTHDEFPEAR
ncbi:protein gp37 [Paraburkholderia sp. HC6.4b]|nr:protein gp37 [Paraburkholderia sp. HC6.4b]MBB5450170.1 protein gp37 [Paraburkholderia sp. Kb1A]